MCVQEEIDAGHFNNIPSLLVDWNALHKEQGEEWMNAGRTVQDRWEPDIWVMQTIEDEGLLAAFEEHGPSMVFAYIDDCVLAEEDYEDGMEKTSEEIVKASAAELGGTPYERDMALYLLLTTGYDQYGFDESGIDREGYDAYGEFRLRTHRRWW